MSKKKDNQLAKSVGAAIGCKRVEAGFTQEAVAEALGLGPVAISRIERGVVAPSLPRLIEFAKLFSCPIFAFLGKTTELSENSEISTLLEGLSPTDQQYIIQLVEATVNHLKSKKNKLK